LRETKNKNGIFSASVFVFQKNKIEKHLLLNRLFP